MPEFYPLHPGDIPRIEEAARVVRTAYAPKAERYGITPENCPSFPAFLSGERLLSALKSQKIIGCAILEGEGMIGFFMLRHMTDDGLLDISRFGILPERQGCGAGSAALDYMAERARALGAGKLYASVMDEDEAVKLWLTGRDFSQTGSLKYAGLPYKVAFMEKLLQNDEAF